ncbi:MAG TPA: SDR family NAD(P)-dependent oxidoreductase [Stellaceae bacterium]|nr:SDR family NAD(P)-dependent oxidoreductase [Stellaceae bacterium]
MPDGSIAIVGASCRFPGGDGLEEFWRLLAGGGDAISQIGPERWSTRFFYHPARGEAGKSYTWSAGLIDGIAEFEPSFFGISPREAVQMDPQQRLLLELVWHASEDAGIPASRLAGADCGVYIGASATDYSDLRLGDPAGADSYFMTGNALSILANRISYVFDLRGPSLAVDTACSSSLVALHHACEAIRAGRIASAIVGGVNLLLAPYPFIGFCRAAMLSPRGRCFAFDDRADGYVRGEGGGVVILKPLAEALAAGDTIRAVILATGTNSDGRTIGLSLPSEAAQAALLASVYAEAQIDPEALAFFEMHGTGTPVGDPVEAAAVGRTIGQRRRETLPIGSVKTNIGHLEPASGMAGLLKAALALERGLIPPTLNCDSPSRNIAFEALNLRLLREAEPLPGGRRQHYAGVNSFGFGGTNAHVVLAAPPRRQDAPGERRQRDEPAPPLLISAAGEAALRALVDGWRSALGAISDERLGGAVRAAARGRDHHRHRLAALGRDRHGNAGLLASLLGGFLDGEAAAEIVSGTAVAEGKLAFVFSGNGAQFPGMGRAALEASAAFRAAIEMVDDTLRPRLGWSVAELIAGGVAAERVARTDIAQPMLFAIQVGIVEALRAAGVTAGGFLGHSVGEIAAAWAAGALSLAEAGHVVVARSRSQQRTQGAGRMAAVALDSDAAQSFLAELDSSAEIAAFNAARSVTLSGSGAEIDRLALEAHRRNLWFRRLDLDFAFHSKSMDPIREELLASLAGLASRPPAARLVSSVTGTAVETGGLDADHWWRNIRNPVRFAAATAALIGEGYRILVEIGPSAILHSYLSDGLRAAGAEGGVVATLSRNDGDGDPFPAIAARCYVAGYDLAAAPGFGGPADPRGLPLYRWQRQHYWLDKTVEANDPESPPFDHPLLGFRQHGPAAHWLNHLDAQVLPWIADHAVEGIAVFPAAAILETAFAAARWRWPEAAALEAFDVEMRRPLPFEAGEMRELRTTILSDDGDWEVASRARLSSEPLTVHAVGRIAAARDARPVLRWADCRSADRPPGRSAPGGERIDAEALYRLAGRAGLDYGRRFRTVDHIAIDGTDGAVVALDPSPIGEPLDDYLLHPALLDGALQGLLGLLAGHGSEEAGSGFLPWRFGRARLPAPFGRAASRARLRLTRTGVRSASADIALYDAAGAIVAEIEDCWLRRIDLGRRAAADGQMFHVDLVPAPLAEFDPPAALEQGGAALARLAASREADPRRHDQALLLDALIGVAALPPLTGWAAPGSSFTIAELIDRAVVAPVSCGLLECLLAALERLGAARESHGEWRLDPASELPDAGEIWRRLLADAPDLVAELALAATAIETLPNLLANGPSRAALWLSPMVEQLLQASPASSAGLDLLGDALHGIAAAWPPDRPLRILEVGALGGVTRRLLRRLAAAGVALSYLATSADAEQVERLGATTQSVVGAAARNWSPKDGADALGEVRFDVVLAAHACARLQLDAAGLAVLRDLLVPGGLLAAVDPEPNAFWDVVFGQAAEWWPNGSPAEAVSPLRSGEEWRDELSAAGFRHVGAAAVVAAPWPSAVFWGSAPARARAAEAEQTPPEAVTIVAGDTPLRAALLDRLAEAGHQVRTEPDRDFPQVVEPGVEGARDATRERVVFLAEPVGVDDPGAAAQIAALARVALAAERRQAALWVITCNAQQAASPAADAQDGSAGAALWGLARVLVNELPRLSVHLVDLVAGAGAGEHARQIADELAAESEETEIVWTSHGRHVLRLRAGLPPRLALRSEALTLASSRPGGFDALGWEAAGPRAPGPGEVEIDVRAAGLNFRDVMWAMGLLPEEALIDGFAGAGYGLECAGIVRAVGPGVEGLSLGDRVMALAPAALGTRVVTPAAAVVPIPAETSFAAAAGLPVAFITAIYALGHLAQLAQGEHVLIHAAAGGVGLAAIQYAKHRGAVVIATAGSDVKRAFLRLSGADHVLDSRDPGFADGVREITRGQGVDVVLNSLSGEAMERSLEALKPFGRFLELGKRDFYLNRRLHLRPLRQNLSYFAIDVDQLPLRRPALARSLLAEISRLLAEDAIRPLAHRVFRFSEIQDAFRLMQASGHIGKLVLVPDRDAALPLRTPPDFAARRDGTYLVTGGLDGFGFEAARWLVAHGAGSIALLGRRGWETPGCAARVAELVAAGAEVRIYQGDVADRVSLAAILEEIRAAQPPLRGVVHAASAIDDRLAGDIDPGGAELILRPKLGGALALDLLTRDDPLELFWLFSSATTLLGAPGQGAYVAANAALEALARQRRAAGRPALAIAWGPIEDAGYLASRPEIRGALARRLGARPIPAAQALAGLPAMIASGLPVVGCAEADWTQARRLLPVLATPLFSELRAKAGSPAEDEAFADRLAEMDPQAALDLLRTVVGEEAARILRLPADGVQPLRPLSQMGMDSLMAVELRLALESRLGIDLPLMSLAEGTSVSSIAARLAGALGARAKNAEIVALVARYEGGGEGGEADAEAAAAAMPQPKPVAAE